jgi:hypothetical protein
VGHVFEKLGYTKIQSIFQEKSLKNWTFRISGGTFFKKA